MRFVTETELVLFAFAAAGMLAHFLVKRLKNEIQVSLFVYFFVERPGLTLATLITVIAACLVVVATGQIEEAKPHIIAALGFGVGYACDSAIGPILPVAEGRTL